MCRQHLTTGRAKNSFGTGRVRLSLTSRTKLTSQHWKLHSPVFNPLAAGMRTPVNSDTADSSSKVSAKVHPLFCLVNLWDLLLLHCFWPHLTAMCSSSCLDGESRLSLMSQRTKSHCCKASLKDLCGVMGINEDICLKRADGATFYTLNISQNLSEYRWKTSLFENFRYAVCTCQTANWNLCLFNKSKQRSAEYQGNGDRERALLW